MSFEASSRRTTSLPSWLSHTRRGRSNWGKIWCFLHCLLTKLWQPSSGHRHLKRLDCCQGLPGSDSWSYALWSTRAGTSHCSHCTGSETRCHISSCTSSGQCLTIPVPAFQTSTSQPGNTSTSSQLQSWQNWSYLYGTLGHFITDQASQVISRVDSHQLLGEGHRRWTNWWLIRISKTQASMKRIHGTGLTCPRCSAKDYSCVKLHQIWCWPEASSPSQKAPTPCLLLAGVSLH